VRGNYRIDKRGAAQAARATLALTGSDEIGSNPRFPAHVPCNAARFLEVVVACEWAKSENAKGVSLA
jgi:hypothetical protein